MPLLHLITLLALALEAGGGEQDPTAPVAADELLPRAGDEGRAAPDLPFSTVPS